MFAPRTKEILSAAGLAVATAGAVEVLILGATEGPRAYRRKFGNYDPKVISAHYCNAISAYDGEIVAVGTITEITFRDGRITGAAVPAAVTDPQGFFRSLPTQLAEHRGVIHVHDWDRGVRLHIAVPGEKSELLQFSNDGVAIPRRKKKLGKHPLNVGLEKLLDSWRSKKAVFKAAASPNSSNPYAQTGEVRAQPV